MCLAIPMQILEIQGCIARCNAKSINREVNRFMLRYEKLAVDDFVMVHVGYAIQKIESRRAIGKWLPSLKMKRQKNWSLPGNK